ncbi:DegT/DnrJ/EryC1/StrS family aminotransferase [Massilia sp. B-10]|nr:DegT/DnrJ/EryC1/StrS family aminotransferase [Massilia sp. B-10]
MSFAAAPPSASAFRARCLSDIRLVTSGRIAIALALREIGAGPGDTVLVPRPITASRWWRRSSPAAPSPCSSRSAPTPWPAWTTSRPNAMRASRRSW